jgi:uncharacterized protein YbbK (DUF523 family)
MILISACLLGENCKYNGGHNLNKRLINLLEKLGLKGQIKPICPEVAGGLPTPRSPSEIVAGEGNDILNHKAKVINKNGSNVTNYFIRGAENVLKDIKDENIDFAIFKARSPSCGSSQIYSGSFDGSIKNGEGVTTAILRQHGISVYSEEELGKMNEQILKLSLT